LVGVKTLIRQALRRVGYSVEGIRHTPRQLLDPACVRRLEFDDVVCRHMHEHGRALSFVQVGGYDGVSTDPLHRYIAACGWSGIMLEPQPRPAARLRELYADNDSIEVVEAAVAGSAQTRCLYTVDDEAAPAWVGGVASFDRLHLLKHGHLVADIGAKIRELQVACVTFDDVLARLPNERLDLLQIDAEGADGALIALFPFERVKPAIVHWESKNLGLADQEATLERLCVHGYRIARSGDEDMLAVLPTSSTCR
jgi:FkbM family methyltransferase